jgi:hypothetical protein
MAAPALGASVSVGADAGARPPTIAPAGHAVAPDPEAVRASAPAADTPTAAEGRVGGCIAAAASVHRVPPAIVLILLDVEGGRLGTVSRDANDTADIGPMQVNTIWVPRIARHWRSSPDAAFLALRDSFCANVEGGTWILRQALDEANGDFWSGVAIYHSHDPVHQRIYLREVLAWTQRLRERSRSQSPAAAAAGR